jgi:hypothetical protein
MSNGLRNRVNIGWINQFNVIRPIFRAAILNHCQPGSAFQGVLAFLGCAFESTLYFVFHSARPKAHETAVAVKTLVEQAEAEI